MENITEKKRILSCIQPTGKPHLGNYFGAIANWVRLQDDYDCFYGIVDYHAMTIPSNAKTLFNNTLNMAKALIACGVRAENLFIQSLVPEHTEMGWIIGCITSYHDLLKQTQFKTKSQQQDKKRNDFIGNGLFSYPALQAADILLYHADLVPVGKDQAQHLELCRTIANRFNFLFKSNYFKMPQTLLTEIPKVMSLADPTKKMSKSYGEKHYIGLFDSSDTILRKVRSAKTGEYDHRKNEIAPGVENLFSILRALGKDEIVKFDFQPSYMKGALSFKSLKDMVTTELIALTSVFGERLLEIEKQSDMFEEMIFASSKETRVHARQTLSEVKELVGLQTVNEPLLFGN